MVQTGVSEGQWCCSAGWLCLSENELYKYAQLLNFTRQLPERIVMAFDDFLE
jgi:hypothetical protein